MIYQFPNPFVTTAVTTVDTDTQRVWHTHPDGTIEESHSSVAFWLRYVKVDADLAMDIGL